MIQTMNSYTERHLQNADVKIRQKNHARCHTVMLQYTVLLQPSLVPQRRVGAQSKTNYMQISVCFHLVNSYHFLSKQRMLI